MSVVIVSEIPIGGFHKCYDCGHVTVNGKSVGNGLGDSIPNECSCGSERILTYYSDCPQCKGRTSHCSFCTNSLLTSTEYKYTNGYIGVGWRDKRGVISSFLRKIHFDGLLSKENLDKALGKLFS